MATCTYGVIKCLWFNAMKFQTELSPGEVSSGDLSCAMTSEDVEAPSDLGWP